MTDLFNEKAKDWDANKIRKMLSSAIGSSILEHVSLHDQMRVMDFGAGTGLISSQVAPLVKKIVAVDISEAMLNKLVSKPELHGKVEIVCHDIIDKPIDENEKPSYRTTYGETKYLTEQMLLKSNENSVDAP